MTLIAGAMKKSCRFYARLKDVETGPFTIFTRQ